MLQKNEIIRFLDKHGIDYNRVIAFLKKDCKIDRGFEAQIVGLNVPSAATTGIITFILGELNELTIKEEEMLKNEILSFRKEDSGFGSQRYSCIWSTSLCVLGLLSLRVISQQEIEESIEYLCRKQSRTGGWSFSGLEKEEDRIIYVSSSVSALIRYRKKFNDESMRHHLERAEKYTMAFNTKNNIDKIIREWLLRVFEGSGITSKRKRKYKTKIDFAEIIESEFRNYIIYEHSIYPFSMEHYTPVTYLYTRKFLRPTHPFNQYLIKYLIENQVDGRYWSHITSREKDIPYSFCTAHSIFTLYTWAHDMLKSGIEFQNLPSLRNLRNQIRRLPHLFISYSKNDKIIAGRIKKALEQEGYPVWFAECNLEVGDPIVDEINKGLDKSDYLLVILSRSSVKSKWVRKELNFGVMKEIEEGKTFVLPILLEDCKRPPIIFQKKYADFRTSFDDGISEILKILEATENDRKDD